MPPDITKFRMKTHGKLFQVWNEDVHEKTAIICCIFMVAGLFFSRALLSLSMFLMFVNALHPSYILQYLKLWKRNTFSMLCLAFFGSYLISGFWSSDTGFWWAATINKLPFVILPFAFFSIPLHKDKVQRIIILSVALMQLAVITYSIFQIAQDWSHYLEGYNVSKPIPTTKYNDHIRFSLSLVLSVFLIVYLLMQQSRQMLSNIWRAILILVIIVFVGYIHLLAAKTGVICLYLSALLFVITQIGRKHKLLAGVIVVAIAILPVMGYYFIPTFKTKIQYVQYEFDQTKTLHHYNYTLSDAGRMITYEIGGKAIMQHPLAGVGAGDIMDEMRKGYQKSYPEVVSDQQFGPINQFMFTALSVGIPLTFILLALSFAPLFLRVKYKIYITITVLALFISLMVEYPLELQFGVFTYLFFMLLWIGILLPRTEVRR